MDLFLGILLLVMAVFLVVSVLMQHGKSHRLSGSIAGGAETFFGKSKGRAVDAVLSKITTVVAIIFVLVIIVMYVAQDNTALPQSGNPNQSQGVVQTPDGTDQQEGQGSGEDGNLEQNENPGDENQSGDVQTGEETQSGDVQTGEETQSGDVQTGEETQPARDGAQTEDGGSENAAA